MRVVAIRAAAGAAAGFSVAAAATASWWLALLAAACAIVALTLTVLYPAPADASPAASAGSDSQSDARPAPALPQPSASRVPAPRRTAPTIGAPPDPGADVVVPWLYEAARQRVPAVAAHLWLEDPATATLRLVCSAGERRPADSPVAATDPVLGAALTTGRSAFEAVARTSEAGRVATLWRFAVPVSAADARGVASVDVARDEDAPSDAARLTELMAAVRGSLAAALALHVATVRGAETDVLVRTAAELSSRLCPDDIIEVALDRAMELSGAATGSVMLPGDDGDLRIVASRGLPDDVVRDTVVREGEGVAGWVRLSGLPMLVEDTPSKPAARRHGVRSSVSAPISDGDGVLGVINVGATEYPARFTEAHSRAVTAIGTQAAIALRNAWAQERSLDLYMSSLEALALALETKDPYAIGATGRVSELVAALGGAMSLSADDLQSLRVAALLHDIGMGMAGSPSSSSRPLTTIDRALLRAHPKVAADLLAQVPALEAVVPIVYHHHEHYDGTGYEAGLAGTRIPLGSRILAVADAFVAMTSERAYRPARSVARALDELNAGSGSQFDPAVVEALSRLLKENPDLAFADR